MSLRSVVVRVGAGILGLALIGGAVGVCRIELNSTWVYNHSGRAMFAMAGLGAFFLFYALWPRAQNREETRKQGRR